MKKLFISLIVPFILVSCGMLEPVKDTTINHLLEPTIPDRSITGSSPVIAIARPALPSYLDREQLVSRSANGQLQMNNYHLWAEPLDAAISRVTAINLGRLKTRSTFSRSRVLSRSTTSPYWKSAVRNSSRMWRETSFLNAHGNCNRCPVASSTPARFARSSLSLRRIPPSPRLH